MNQVVIRVILGFIDKIPMGSYRTYIINFALIVAWSVFMLFGGSTELGAIAIGAAMSNIFIRKSNEAQTAKMIYIESLLQDVTVQLARHTPEQEPEPEPSVLDYDPIDATSVEPTGPHADTRVR